VRQVPKGWDGSDEVSQEDAERLIARLIIEDADRRGWKWEDRTGNGADDGADVMVFDPAGLHIFEIKWFKKPRLGKVQRQQVKDSLTQALKHKPVRWTLAIPTDPTVAEGKWLTGLPQAIAGATDTSSADKTTAESLAVDWLPRNDLTVRLLTRYPHLLRLVQTEAARAWEVSQMTVTPSSPSVGISGMSSAPDIRCLLGRYWR
jgi:hypothetical protein